MTTTVIGNIGELTTNDPRQGDQTAMGRLFDAALVVDEERILWIGRMSEAPDADDFVDVEGAAVMPGFVDSHTHLIFAGDRADEFEARMVGSRYNGGGIRRTVDATRAASAEQLRRATATRVGELQRGGVTTMEIKSGYELTLEGETRLVTLAKEFSDEVTFLGAHVVPEEFANARDAYVELVAGSMLSSCEPHAKWADVFCDVGAFSVDEARTVLLAAKAAGLGLRLHANQLGHGGGVQLAVELEATSVDHCTYLSDEDVDSLANSSCVATLLPGAEFSTKSDYPDARRLLDAGVTVALATDCNPGTSYVTNMGFVVSLAVRDMGMSVDQALWSATRGGAMALGRDDIGLLAPGTRADFLILDAPTAKHVAYRAGSVIVRETRRSSR